MSLRRKGLGAALAAASVALLVSLGVSPAVAASASAAPPLPSSMAALGDSISQGTDSAGYGNFPANSWSTGSSAAVDSQATRLSQKLGHPITTFNDSVAGSTSSALPGQAATAVSQGAQYVTIEIGANDACAWSATSAATFQQRIGAALASLQAGSSVSAVQVVSVPNLQQLYNLEHGKLVSTVAWLVACPILLVSPATAQARVNQYNAILAAACAAESKCSYADISGFAFTAAQISPFDDFHPSVAGQAQLAALTAAASPWGP